MKISVVMAVYNGARYLKEQLESLNDQSRKADEVILMNDCSTDNTMEIVKSFVEKNGLDSWILIDNPYNLGWRKNFVEGIKRASGDCIFLCDQDDVWHKDKIESMSRILEQNSEILLLASNYSYLYEEGMHPVRNRYLRTDKTVEKYNFSEKFLYVERPGCVYTMRRKLAEIVATEWYDRSAHDSLAWRIAELMDGLYIYNDATIDFRRHVNSATATKRKVIADKISDCKFWRETAVHLLDICKRYEISQKAVKMRIIQRMAEFALTREKMFETKNPLRWLACLRYRKYYYSDKIMLADLLYVLRRK